MDLNAELPETSGPAGHAGASTVMSVHARDRLTPGRESLVDIYRMDSLLEAQDEERLRMGRELHDSTGQLLLALRLGIAHLKQVHGTGAEEDAIDEIEMTALQIDREIRSFAFTHYPASIGQDGLAAALQYLARGFGIRTGLCVKFTDRSQARVDDGPEAVALLRVAQEALTNVHRHAGAAHVRVDLTSNNDMIERLVRDDGRGIASEFENGGSSGVGLQGMRHRIERLAGQFSIRRLKHGTRLSARIPLPA